MSVIISAVMFASMRHLSSRKSCIYISTHSHSKASFTDAFANAYTSNTHGTL